MKATFLHKKILASSLASSKSHHRLCAVIFTLFALTLLGGLSATFSPNFAPQPANAAAKTFDWLQQPSEYQAKLANQDDTAILADQNTKLALLQFTFANRVGYQKLVDFAASSSDNEKALQWLFTDFDRLEAYLLGGTPEGGTGKYIDSLKALSKVYAKYSADLADAVNGTVYQKMMMAISLAYGNPVNGWQTANDNGKSPWITANRTPSEPDDRYAAIKSLYLGTVQAYEEIPTQFNAAEFRDLEIEEMRWVVNNRISDKEIPWLNWYTQKVKQGKTGYSENGENYMNPYTYISYDGTFKWYYEDREYYMPNSTHCAIDSLGNMNKSNAAYQRGESCNEKYGLSYFDLETTDESPLRLWTIWEEDGVCGSIAGVGTNIQMAYGIPSSLVSQPGHAAYFQSRLETYHDETRRLREINNNCGNWSNSYKGERMTLNWGTRNNGWSDWNNASYLIAAQSALDDFAAFKTSFYYNLLADFHTDSAAKIASYSSAIESLGYNVDSWYGLIQVLLQDDADKFDQTETMAKYQKLAEAIMSHMKEFPLPMYDLLKLIVDKVGIYQVAYMHHFNKTLNELSQLKPTEKPYFQTQAILDIVRYIQGKAADTDIAEFSFDGDDGMILKLKNGARDAASPFEYSITTNLENYEDTQNIDDTDDPNNGDWIQVTDHQLDVDLKDDLEKINDTNDILVHLMGTPRQEQNIFRIDLTQGEADEIEVNELERKIAGADPDKAEWITIDIDEDAEAFMALLQSEQDPYGTNNLDWKELSQEQPVINDESNKHKFDLWFRYGYTGTHTPSPAVNISYGDKPIDNPTVSYISNENYTVSSTLEDQSQDTSLPNLLDNDRFSFWQNHPDDEQHFLTYAFAQPIQLIRLDYIIQQQKNPAWGNIIKAQIQTSLDGETYQTAVESIDWPWKQDQSSHPYTLSEPVYAKYVRIIPLEVYNNNSNVRVTMFNFYQNKEAKVKLTDLEPLATLAQDEFTYTGQPFEPAASIDDYNETTLQPGQDFTTDYTNNTDAGTATVTLTGVGDHYTGTLTKEFTIKKAAQPFTQPNDAYTLSAENGLRDVKLPDGWQWEDGNLDVAPGQTVTTAAVYRGADAKNFENNTKSVQLSRAASGDPNPAQPSQSGDSGSSSNPIPSGGQNVPAGPGDMDYTTSGATQIAQADSADSARSSAIDPLTGQNSDSSSTDNSSPDPDSLTDGPLKDGARVDYDDPSATATDSNHDSNTDSANETIDQDLTAEDQGMVLYVVIGAVLVIALFAGLFIYFRHRRSR